MPIERLCLVCSAPFLTIPAYIRKGGGKYCSSQCANSRTAIPRIPCVCLTCQQPFAAAASEIRRGGGKYCSVQCSHAAKRPGPRVVCLCQSCHQEFFRPPSVLQSGGGKYCSSACYHQRELPPYIERFWAYVNKTDTCWLWQGNFSSSGYGRFGMDGKRVQAHRLAYELTYGPILPGVCVCHHCDTPACVRPEHLFLGTNGDNLRDMVNKGRHVSVVHPGYAVRGDRHPRRLYPERYTRGEQHTNAKLTAVQVCEIRRLRTQEDMGYMALARAFGVSQTLIIKIVRREIWKHLLDTP